ncbi:MAG: alcohol dehydrogenase catalytic domain-containing protein [Streptosporangiales bacterium]|nr:alcohol dehydrogenase catalytic domain-containing protein [Streptosporangiales bacterium]
MNDTMRAARWHAAGDVRVEDVPIPAPGDGEVLVRVERAGLCGTDLEEYLEGPVLIPVTRPHPRTGGRAPIVLGHELVGTVVATTTHDGPAVGTRVVPDGVVGCGSCWWCLRHEEILCPTVDARGLQSDGGLAEYLVAEAATCVTVPATVPVDVAAFAEPVAVAVRALAKAGDLTGRGVVIVGAGVIGQLVAQVALHSGATSVLAVDPVEDRRRLASRFGAHSCPPGDGPATVAELTDGRGADVVVECSGAPGTLAGSVALSRPGGTIVLVGLRAGDEPVPLLPVVLGERRLVGTASHLWDVDIAAAVALLSRGVVATEPLLTATVPLERVVPDGFERLRTDRTTLKILVDPRAAAPE